LENIGRWLISTEMVMQDSLVELLIKSARKFNQNNSSSSKAGDEKTNKQA
jgi:hypothetical protein